MPAAGLYDPRFEHDACGVGFVADLSGRGGHDVVARALRVLCNLEHRGAKGGDPGTGDGAGILTQIPDEFFRASCDFELPDVLQLFVAGAEGQHGMELERMAFCLRKRVEHEAGVYFASLSARTIVY